MPLIFRPRVLGERKRIEGIYYCGELKVNVA
jgi:hypothetical protein